MSSWRKNGQDLAQTSRKWRKKISNGESDGERKIYPSANPETTSLILNNWAQGSQASPLGQHYPHPHHISLKYLQLDKILDI